MSTVVIVIMFALCASSACADDHDNERTLEWTGLHFNAGNDVLFKLKAQPGSGFPDSSAKSVPLIAPIDNSGFATYSYNWAGPAAPGTAYYYVDGNGNGQCDEYNPADPRGTQDFAANDELIAIEFVDSSFAPEGVCTHFGADLDQQAALPTATLTPSTKAIEVVNPTIANTPGPTYEELYEDAAVAAVQRYFDASNAHDLAGIRKASIKDRHYDDNYIEQQKVFADMLFGESDYATFQITNLYEIDCTEFECELILDVDKYFPSGEGGSIRIPQNVEFEDGEWKYAS